MAANTIRSWYPIDPSTFKRLDNAVREISQIGVYSLADDSLPCMGTVVPFVSRGGDRKTDPVGTVMKIGIRSRDGLAPVDIEGGAITLASIAENGQDLIPVEFTPLGNICLTVDTIVAPIVVEVAHA